MTLTEDKILELLKEVKDPEIPVISLVDLGVITGIEINEDHVTVNMTPTFIGCPAMDYMKQDVVDVLNKNGIENHTVNLNLKTTWSSDLISDEGKRALKKFGLALPSS